LEEYAYSHTAKPSAFGLELPQKATKQGSGTIRILLLRFLPAILLALEPDGKPTAVSVGEVLI